jgi:hypothetical protein
MSRPASDDNGWFGIILLSSLVTVGRLTVWLPAPEAFRLGQQWAWRPASALSCYPLAEWVRCLAGTSIHLSPQPRPMHKPNQSRPSSLRSTATMVCPVHCPTVARVLAFLHVHMALTRGRARLNNGSGQQQQSLFMHTYIYIEGEISYRTPKMTFICRRTLKVVTFSREHCQFLEETKCPPANFNTRRRDTGKKNCDQAPVSSPQAVRKENPSHRLSTVHSASPLSE